MFGLAGWAGAALAAPVSVSSHGQLPAGARFLISADTPRSDGERIAACLPGAGGEAAPPTHLVQFSRALRAGKTSVAYAPVDAEVHSALARRKRGRVVEVAALAVTDIASGATVLRLQATRRAKLREKRAPDMIAPICTALTPAD